MNKLFILLFSISSFAAPAEESFSSLEAQLQSKFHVTTKPVFIRDLIKTPNGIAKKIAPKQKLNPTITQETTPAGFVFAFMNGYVFNPEKTIIATGKTAVRSFQLKILEGLSMGQAKEHYEKVDLSKTPKHATFFKKVEITIKTQSSEKLTYQAVLEFDSDSKLIGGEWLSQTHPDQISFLL